MNDTLRGLEEADPLRAAGPRSQSGRARTTGPIGSRLAHSLPQPHMVVVGAAAGVGLVAGYLSAGSPGTPRSAADDRCWPPRPPPWRTSIPGPGPLLGSATRGTTFSMHSWALRRPRPSTSCRSTSLVSRRSSRALNRSARSGSRRWRSPDANRVQLLAGRVSACGCGRMAADVSDSRRDGCSYAAPVAHVPSRPPARVGPTTRGVTAHARVVAKSTAGRRRRTSPSDNQSC